MKKFTLIKEQQDHQYTWRAIVKVEGVVTAGSEGDAGYQADEAIEAMPHILSHEIIEIVRGDQMGKPWSEHDDDDSDDLIEESMSISDLNSIDLAEEIAKDLLPGLKGKKITTTKFEEFMAAKGAKPELIDEVMNCLTDKGINFEVEK